MSLNKKNSVILSFAFLFAACGGDSGSNATNEESSSDSNSSVSAIFTYKTYEGLASERPCGQSLNMVVAHVRSMNQDYMCCYDAALKEGTWQPYLDGPCSDKESEFSKVSSSSKLPTSSSVVKSSSSLFMSSSSDVHETDGEYFVDDRDGQAYKIVTIGSQIWMAQNLNYDEKNSYCYGNKDENCSQYGRLYYGTNHCPAGWHLPTIDEWNVLIGFVGGASVAGKMLKSASGWNEFGNGIDAYEFSALPAGSAYAGASNSFSGIGDAAVFMADTVKNDSMSVHYLSISGEKDGVSFWGLNKKYMDIPSGTSIRCLKGNSAVDVGKTSASSSSVVPRSSSSSFNSTLIDSRDGQSYKVVKIGEQIWMAQNLNFETEDSYCYDDDEVNCSKYGRLYTWASAMDGEGLFSGNAVGCSDGKKCSPTYPVRGVCPMGWHLPSRDEWETLLKFVGEDNAVTLLRAKVGWEGDGTDRYGFSALPAGGKVDYGVYLGLGKKTCFWSSSEKYSNSADTFTLHSVAIVIDDGKFAGYSVRCVMD